MNKISREHYRKKEFCTDAPQPFELRLAVTSRHNVTNVRNHKLLVMKVIQNFTEKVRKVKSLLHYTSQSDPYLFHSLCQCTQQDIYMCNCSHHPHKYPHSNMVKQRIHPHLKTNIHKKNIVKLALTTTENRALP